MTPQDAAKKKKCGFGSKEDYSAKDEGGFSI